METLSFSFLLSWNWASFSKSFERVLFVSFLLIESGCFDDVSGGIYSLLLFVKSGMFSSLTPLENSLISFIG